MILFDFYHPIVKYTKQPCLSKKKREKEGKQKRRLSIFKIAIDKRLSIANMR